MNPSEPVQWRLVLAREISTQLVKYPGIRASFVAGSAARGYADEYSDLEIALFWDTLPADETRQSMAAALGADLLYPYNGPANEDNLLVHGFQVDFWHITVRRAEAVIQSVLDASSLDAGDSNFMDTLRFCIPLFGEDLIAAWKARAREYPEALALRNIEQALREMETTHLALLVKRDNPTLLYGQISAIQQKLFLLLLALNRRYFPTYKWMYRILGEMAVKPDDIEARFRRAYTCPPEEAVADTVRLMKETLQLVQQQFPRLDTRMVWNQLKVTRNAHSKPVTLKTGG